MKFGFVVMLAENDHLGRAPVYQEIRYMAKRAERLGFDSIWLYDHLLYRPEDRPTIGIWECWTVLSALAEATGSVELGTLVLCNSFRNPAILAKMAVTLDDISSGRYILGIGAGWNEPEYKAFGLPFDHRVDRFEEAIQIIKPLLKEGRVDFKGNYYSAEDCQITPFGPRKPGPPLMFGAFKPRMLRLTAMYADIWNSGYYAGPDTFQEALEEMKSACGEVGRDMDTLGITCAISLNFPDLGDPPKSIEENLSGTTSDLVEAFLGYESMGVEHLMFHCTPYNDQVMDRLAEAVGMYRTRL